ncbi:unnamed protein product [Microthlaspi erraticum]|uniref:Uncharacterized protein n=1 Tax=Microthlaspi erraticum TaxID=1685480 RepID=A0A6D2KWN6_9BRAS|nr:unnamed protein product [Microthlaspi erraticum]
MGIKPIISRTRDGRRSGEIAHAGNSCLSLSSSNLQVTAYNTRPKGRKLKCWRGDHTYLCAAGVKWTREGLLHQVGWTSSFARPTFSLSTRSWMGDSNSSSPTHWLDSPSFSCLTQSSPQ